jgi:hypothetical protein
LRWFLARLVRKKIISSEQRKKIISEVLTYSDTAYDLTMEKWNKKVVPLHDENLLFLIFLIGCGLSLLLLFFMVIR